ncbi:MAG: hypothetical protein GWO24_05970, partial [Akkermansiaceae bacterium]|nr:hypothetical protein [Akkermansiaceae bacterium]
MVTGGRNHDFLKIWDRESLQLLLAFEVEGWAIELVASPDETTIAVRSEDNRIEFWRAPSFEELEDARSAVEVYP